jgi:hypothetical protein
MRRVASADESLMAAPSGKRRSTAHGRRALSSGNVPATAVILERRARATSSLSRPIRPTSPWALSPITPMSYSIRFNLPSPPQGAPADVIPRFLFAIRGVALDRFDGSMHVMDTELPPSHGRPASSGFQVTLSFHDSVNPLEVTRALDEVFDHAEEIVSSVRSSE